MTYSDGQHVTLGDRVRLWESVLGVIVCAIDDNAFSPGFPRDDWGYKERGAVIKADDGRLFYYDEADEDFELLARAGAEAVSDKI
jgi:hypothetical protein